MAVRNGLCCVPKQPVSCGIMVHYDVWNAAYYDAKKSLLLCVRKFLNVKLYEYLYFMQLKTRSCFYFSIFCCQNFFTVRIAYLYIFRCCSGVACSYVRDCQEGVLTWAMEGSEGALYTECDDCKN